MNCQTCTNPTKYVVGFWDGKDTSGYIYNCNDASCLVKQENMEKALAEREKMNEVDRINQSNGIDMGAIKAKRKELLLTINKMALKLRIMCSDYSNYEMCRKALPVEMRDRIEGIFGEVEN